MEQDRSIQRYASVEPEFPPWFVWPRFGSEMVWTRVACVRLLLTMALVFFSSWIGIVLSHQSEGVATIWMSNGILFGLVITRPRHEWLAYFLAGLAADTFADVVYGDPFSLAIGVSLANTFEVVASCVLLTHFFGFPLNLAKPRTLFGFLSIAAIGATTVCSIFGAFWTVALTSSASALLPMFRTWYLGDMLGMALLGPLTFMLQRSGLFAVFARGRRLKTCLLLLLTPVTTALVFLDSHDPLIFLIFPMLLLNVFLLGFSGTIFAIFLIAFESIAFTVRGYGPMMLVPGAHMMLHRVILVQIFLAVSLFSTFPVAALLEERAELTGSLAQSEKRYRTMADADELTGLNNRRAFNLFFEEQWHNSSLVQQSIAALMIDADHFKRYNDLHGHLAGDACLCSIAAAIASVAHGERGFVARFGGEEFAVILPGASRDTACRVAEQVRQGVASMRLCPAGTAGSVHPQTVSIGVASLVPTPDGQSRELLRLADQALYQAKDRGRNRVACLDDKTVLPDEHATHAAVAW